MLMQALLNNESAVETTVAEYFSQRDISFVSLTQPLRKAVLSGLQPYFTYDQHWTPEGHRVVADAVVNLAITGFD